MIVDSSAIVAILQREPEAVALAKALVASASPLRISAVTYVELGIVIDSKNNPIQSRRVDDFLRQAEIGIEPVTVEQARIAREAYRDFGKGRHKAGLNLGDCFSYALAKAAGLPLLFKGDDFRRTDIEVAEY